MTTDSVLNAYTRPLRHPSAAHGGGRLFDQLGIMTEALYETSLDQWNDATHPLVKEAARLNMAYFAVADSLLNGVNIAPDVVSDEVDRELALIEAMGGLETSPILGYPEDYSQYKPRGHYTRSERLQRYFKTMMWYGHTAFYVNPRGSTLPENWPTPSPRAILISASLAGPAKEAWSAIYEPTAFLVVGADDITVDDMRTVVAEVFGTDRPAPDDVATRQAAPRQGEVNKLRPPRILTAGDREARRYREPGGERTQLRVMGQRYIPDSYAFQQLVWALVGEEANRRDLPMGLDVMAVLGSDQAHR